ncbi:hypothetical protein [Bifidobacterium longum]|uniref:Colicin transporter n=2 Tax=Bifidobacterium longum subsp. infantis TaxID=1682 RepID=A0ABM9R4N2_BIFLI|nr:hypothetical protein [Bifidobacterium longum]ACJ52321.1 conserved hypothetical protein [Bifidobacterium longum subsp. infantis ATCC 15697 = JCM 1222 = DSM 20088]MBX4249232.1 hypothetical protein [Bifidobacterium longum subsp. infantis]CEE98123.1 hypothetical protein BLIC_a01317 [Bifidobacterium longum subsp. infantis]CEF00451.1 hypothetical protein BLIC_b01320 [Bifidobacterium longum subsp. infantis]CEF01564.1 hypothetical protein BLIC_c01324 [Bifidobacterium longum subsp. infantis]
MNGSNPVPLPPAEPSGAARAASKPKWMVPAIAVGCAVVLLSAGGGYLYWSHGRLAEASAECEAAYSKAVKGRRELAGYLKSDALKTAITVRDSEVEDAKTVAVLASTVKAVSTMKTDIPGCPADGLKGIRAAAARLDRAAAAYAKTVNEVRGKADAVSASKTDKTVADATKVLDDSKGRVEDDKVRTALENAIKSRDGKAISDAVKAVNDSIKAKSDADAKAEAEKEGQAADNGSSYTGDTTGGHIGYTGGGYTQSQGGGYTYTPQQPAGNGGGYTPAPQPAPQPTPQPPQGNNVGGSGGDDGWDTCFTGDTSGKPGIQVPCS